MSVLDRIRGRGSDAPPTHKRLKLLDTQQLMRMFMGKDVGGAPTAALGSGYSGAANSAYRTGPGRLSALLQSYGGTNDSDVFVFACVSLIASTLGSYPWRFVDGEGETIENPPDDLARLLAQPNPDWTYFDLAEAVMTDLELVGNAYILKDEQNGLGQPKSLHRLPPERMRIAVDAAGMERGYVYTPRKGLTVPYEAWEVMHFRYPNPLDDHYGMGTVEAIAANIDRHSAAGLHLTGFFQNGMRISGVLTIPETLSDTQFERLKQSYSEGYAGPANAFKVLIAEGAADYKPISEGPQAAGVVDLMKLSKDEILSGFGIPAPMLGGLLETANYKMEDSQHIFTRAMIPRSRRFAERFTTDLAALWSVEFRVDAHANEPMEVRIAHAREALGAGASLNQALEMMGLPLSDDPNADKPLIPNNLIPLDIVGLPPRPGRSIPMEARGEPGAPNDPNVTPGAAAGAVASAAEAEGEPVPPGVLDDLPDAVATSTNGTPPKNLDRVESLVEAISKRIDEAQATVFAERAAPPPSTAEPEGRTLSPAPSTGPDVLPRPSLLAATSTAHAAWGRGKSGSRARPSKDWSPPSFPRGFEKVTKATTEEQQATREHQARVLRVGVDAFEPAFRKYFREQRARVLDALAQFGSNGRALRGRPTKAKDDLTPEAIFSVADENAALRSVYLAALDQVGVVAVDVPEGLVGGVSWDLANPHVASLRDSMAEKVTRVNETTRAKIADTVEEGMRRGYSVTQIANGYPEEKYPGVTGVFDEATDVRAETIARSESAMAFNGAQVVGYRGASVERVEVMDGTENDQECADADGAVWTLDDYAANPIEHPNCSRTAVPTTAPLDGEPE